MTGTSAEIPLGAPIGAFLDEDVPVLLAEGSTAAPLKAVPPPGMAVPAQTAKN